MKRMFAILLAGFVASFSTSLWAVDFLEKKAAKLGQAVPDFELKDTAGALHKLSDYKGKVVMIHFWSATCPFVIRYDDRLKEIASAYTDRGVQVLGIDSNTNETPKQIKRVANGRKVNYPVLIDPASKVADQFGAITTPHVFFIDREGKLVYEGAVDDQGCSEDNPVSKRYVRENLEAYLAGSPLPYSATKSVGCTVKRE